MTPGFRLRPAAFAAMTLLVPFASADLVANFDDLVEGQVFNTFTNGGITFSNVSRHQGGFTNFVIEDASAGNLGAWLSSPNVLGFGGYVPGPGMAFGAFGEMTFSSLTEATTAGLDLWTFPLDMGGNTLTLTGYMDGAPVNSVSFTFPNAFEVLHARLDLPSDTYTSFRLWSTGPAVSGDSFIDVDNVTVAAVPEPATFAALGIGALALLRRRRAS